MINLSVVSEEHMPRRIIDVDWNRHHLAALEWEHRHERRLNQRLSEYHRNLEKRGQAPWVALGQSKADADYPEPRSRSSGSAVPAVPSRSSLGGASTGMARSPSTSLSNLWRRALQSGSTNSSASERTLERLQASEAWQKACAKVGQEELIDLVGHVHGQILDERRKRREAQKLLPTGHSPGALQSQTGPRLTSPAMPKVKELVS